MIAKNLIKQFKNGVTYLYQAPVTKGNPTVCFIPGFGSDFITSKKSNLVYTMCVEENGYGFLSWNHRPEGGSVYAWYQEGLELVKEHKVDYFVGASMGLWLSLLLSMELKDIKGILTIGGGVDFTERWLKNEVPQDHKDDVSYVWKRPSRYEVKGYYEIPIKFLIDSRPALLSNQPEQLSKIECPVYLIHGDKDEDVSGEKTYHFLSKYMKNLNYFELEGGDHQLSRDQDLTFIRLKIMELMK